MAKLDLERTARNKERFLEAFVKTKGIIHPACKAINISRQMVFYWRREDKEFNEKFNEILEAQGDMVENKLIEAIENGDTTATIFYCKTKLRNRGYNEKQDIELSANKGEGLKIEIINKVEDIKPDTTE